MIRTRDFLLFLITLAFLLVVITTETARQWFARGEVDVPTVTMPAFNDDAPSERLAEVVAKETIDRPGNIARLREQLSAFMALPAKVEEVIEAPQIDEVVSPATSTTEVVTPVGTALRCGAYRPYAGTWPNQLLSIEEQEGVRVVSIKNNAVTPGDEQVVLVLPIRTEGTPSTPVCLLTDVVAIAQSGSLIRNTDVVGYRAFPEHMLLGHTLDGFPLYGYSDRATDRCGGVEVDGTYRYYLSTARETALDCFVAPPVALP